MNYEPSAIREERIRLYRTLCREQRRLLKQARWHLKDLRHRHAVDAAQLADQYGAAAQRVAAELRETAP